MATGQGSTGNVIAALASVVIPGLGQLIQGRLLKAVVMFVLAGGMSLLLDEPLGMGPLRWRQIFNLEPHNSYIGSFANGGWVGGAVFIVLVAATTFVGFRLMTRASPYRAYAQIVFPALLMFFVQAMQIDVEKWRHVYMMLGMVWALEAARLRWAAR